MKLSSSFLSRPVLPRRLAAAGKLRRAGCLAIVVIWSSSESLIRAQENAEPSVLTPRDSTAVDSGLDVAGQSETTLSIDLFSGEVAAILNDHCVACHGAKKTEGGYRLDSYQQLMEPGDSAEAPIVAGEPDASLLVQRIMESDPSQRMPPDGEALTAEQSQKIRHWIQTGAHADPTNHQLPLTALIPPLKYPPPPSSYPPIPLTAVAFSPDQRHVICSGHHELTIWDVASQKMVRRISNLGEKIFAIAVHPDSDLLAVACGEPGRRGEVRMIDYQTGNVLDVVTRANDAIWDVAFRPGRDEIAVASADLTVKIVQYKTKETLVSYASHADWVTALAFSADGSRLASASRDKSAKVFDLETGQMLISYAGHAHPVRGVMFTPDGTQLLTVGDDKKLHRWNVSDGKQAGVVGLEGVGFRISFHDGFAYVPTAAGKVHKIDLNNNNLTLSYSGHSDWVLSSAVAKDGRVVAGGQDGTVRIWSPDGNLLASWQSAPE